MPVLRCSTCKARKDDDGYKVCPKCRAYSRRYMRERRATDPEFAARQVAVMNKMRACPEYRARANARRRERYWNEPEYRRHIKAYAMERYWRTCGGGYRKHLPDLWNAQSGICGLCGKPLPYALEETQVDHILAVSKGGTDDVENLHAVHRSCNAKKGNRPGVCPLPWAQEADAC